LNYEAKVAAATQLREKGKADKADAAQRECDEMRETFEAAGRDTLDVIELANLVCEYETADQLADYLEAVRCLADCARVLTCMQQYQQYYAKCNAWLAQATPLIARSREFAERRRAEAQQVSVM
jgi:hypothetical protein